MPPKLSPDITTSIARLLTRTRLTQNSIAARCGVSSTTVSAIAREIGIGLWARKSERKRRSPAQPARDREIIRQVAMGRTYGEVGKRYGISRQRVHQIAKLYRHAIIGHGFVGDARAPTNSATRNRCTSGGERGVP